MRNSKGIFAIGLMTALASLAGCAKIRYPSLYVLSPPTPAPTPGGNLQRPALGTVAVRQFDAPSYLRAGAIVYRESPERLAFYDYDRWAMDPRRAVTAAVIQEMEAHTAFQSVDLFDGRGNPDYLVTGAIDHLEEVDHGANVSVEVSLSARLIDNRTGEVLWRGSLSKLEKLDQRSVPGVVAAMSRDLGAVVAGLVASMTDRAPAVSQSKPGEH